MGIMLTGPVEEMAILATGHDKKSVAKLHAGFEKMFRSIPKTMQSIVIAEVAKAEHCFAGVKVGDKLVFDPFLNAQKSTGILCPRALIPVLIQINAIWEMAFEWAESGKETPSEIVFRNARCLDPGFEDGGIGGVIYQIRFENINP
jgi:hypothetical protein